MAGKPLRKKSSLILFFRIALAGLAIVLILVLYFPNMVRLKNLKKENKTLLTKITDLEAEISDLEQKLKNVDNDPYLLESIARDQLGIAREGELVIEITE